MVKKVGVLSREGHEHYKWFTIFLFSFLSQEDVIPIYISNSNPYKHWDEISKCSFVILYHSKKRGRINVTDVTDSLYGDELQSLSRELGKTNVIVLIDDLDEGTDDEKNRILGNQPSIKSLASELFIFSVKEKAAYTNNSSHLELYGSADNKLQKIKGLIQRKHFQVPSFKVRREEESESQPSIRTRKEEASESQFGAGIRERDPIMQDRNLNFAQRLFRFMARNLIWVIFVCVIFILILVLSITLGSK